MTNKCPLAQRTGAARLTFEGLQLKFLDQASYVSDAISIVQEFGGHLRVRLSGLGNSVHVVRPLLFPRFRAR